MNCPKCKNPIEDNAAFCQWCGAVVDNSVIENQENDFEYVIKNMLTNTKYDDVVQYYKETTGKNTEESKYEVSRLDYFRTHEFADETAWQKYYEEYQENRKSIDNSIQIIGWILFIIIAIFLAIGIIVSVLSGFRII